MSLLRIEKLSLRIGAVRVLRGVDLSIEPGEVVGLVGESGSGKTLTALAVMRLLPPGSEVAGTVEFDGRDLLALDERAMCAFRGRASGIVFQEPMTALNPLLTIGQQVAEAFRAHGLRSRREAFDRAGALLERVGLRRTGSDPNATRMNSPAASASA